PLPTLAASTAPRCSVASFLSSLRLTGTFSFIATAPTEIYTLSLHDALPIFGGVGGEIMHGYYYHRPGDYERIEKLPHAVAYAARDRKSTRLNSSHVSISYAVFCLKKKNELVHEGDRHAIKVHTCYFASQHRG